MQPMHLEFGPLIFRRKRVAYLCLGLLLVLNSISAMFLLMITRSSDSLEARLSQNSQLARSRDAVKIPDALQAEGQQDRLKAAQNVVQRLQTPWASLFVALEESSTGDVAVLRIEPDAAHQEVRITADASTMSHAVAYAAGLRRSGALTRVFIASQRASGADPENPLQVVILARWAPNSAPERRTDRSSTKASIESIRPW